MVTEIPDPQIFNSNEKIILSGLIGTLFEFLFGLEVIFNSVFLSQNLVGRIISAAGFFIVFVSLCVVFRLKVKTLIVSGMPLVFSYLLLVFLIPGQTWPVFTAFVLFVLGNSIIGILDSRKKNKKSVSRRISTNLFIFSSVSSFVMLLFISNNPEFLLRAGYGSISYVYLTLFAVSLVISIFIAVLNVLNPKGLRNFLFPLVTAVLLYITFSVPRFVFSGRLETAFIASVIISFASYRLKFLTAEGSITQFALAFLILGIGGWKWTIPIIVFFLSSSLISKLKSGYKKDAELYFEKTSTRDSNQVLANGGVGGLLVLINALYPSELYYLAYVSSLAVVCSDTWGTEIGTLLRAKTVSIKNFVRVDQGTSGGISLPGIAGAFIGAFIIPISSLFWIRSIFLISGAGFLGSIIDSYLGAVFQAQYKCNNCGKNNRKRNPL